VKIPAGGSIDYVPASNVFSVFVGGFLASGTGPGPNVDVIFVPLSDTIASSQVRSPLGFTLKQTGGGTRKLVGTFYSANGIELRQGTSFKVQFEMEPTTTAKSLGQLFLSRTGAPSTDRLWADCTEFRGVLYGGPLLVFPGSVQANVDPNSDYIPGNRFLRIEPGPVTLGGYDRIQQPALGPGYTDCPVSPVVLGDVTTTGPVTFEADLTSCAVGAVQIKFTWTTSTQLRVQAFRKFFFYDGTEWTSSVASADELFAPIGGSNSDPNPYFALVELEEGFYSIKLSAVNQSATAVAYGIEKYR